MCCKYLFPPYSVGPTLLSNHQFNPVSSFIYLFIEEAFTELNANCIPGTGPTVPHPHQALYVLSPLQCFPLLLESFPFPLWFG